MADQNFLHDIRKFNEIYRLPSHEQPTLLPIDRISNFQNILAEEVAEGSEIAAKYEALRDTHGDQLPLDAQLEVLTDLADWLGDIVVYCASEARRWGLPLTHILNIIMESNFSKLDEAGLPIYDQRGKVMKGPHYWKPEPKIKELLKTTLPSQG